MKTNLTAGFLTVAWALTGMGCTSDSTQRPTLMCDKLLGKTLIALDGTSIAATELIGETVLFTCGCEPCKIVGKELRSQAKEFYCVNTAGREALVRFLNATKWPGKAYLDVHAQVAIALDSLNCPRLVRIRDSGIEELSVTQK